MLLILGKVQIFAQDMPPELFSALVIKIIPYVLNFKDKDTIKIKYYGEDVYTAALKNYNGKKINEKTIIVGKDLKNFNIFFFSGKKEEFIKVESEIRKNEVLSIFVNDITYLKGTGILGIKVEDGKPCIYLNTLRAKEVGLNFTSDFMRLIKIYQ
ncbi:MAG: YfiR/HmsC family protein [Candidatus Hydrothermales bacterium]